MSMQPMIVSPTHQSTAAGFWQKFLAFVVRRRVALTGALFVLLLIEDVWNHTQPLDLAAIRDYRVLLGVGLVLGGLALRSWAAGTLHKCTELTMSGPYGLVRHPLYIGSFMMMVGFCQLIDDKENIWFVVGPVLALYIYHAIREEKFLASRFPDQWAEFSRKVPRFFPRRLPKQLFSTWSIKQWLHNREYEAASAVALGLVALQIWQFLERS